MWNLEFWKLEIKFGNPNFGGLFEWNFKYNNNNNNDNNNNN